MSDINYSAIPEIIFGDTSMRDGYITETGGKAGSDKNTFAKFTFKKGFESNLIYPFPSALETFIDTGVFYLTEADYLGFDYVKFLESIPYAQIRAYEPHTVMQFGSDIMSTIFAGIEYANNNGIREAGVAVIDGFVNTASELAHFFTSLCNKESFDAFSNTFSNAFDESYAAKKGVKIEENDLAILDIPYNLYYKILGSTTNAIYEIPCQFPDETLKSDGKFGWDSNEFSAFKQIGDFSTGSLKEALTFQFLLSFASKLNMTMMPVFSPNNSTSDPDGFTITFDLVNDTADHAKANFAFIQTITGNNKWIQNLIVTRPANLYDIRIPGCNRLMMCTGEFTIEFKGAVRTFTTEALKNFNEQPFGKDFRIPEAYSVSMKFNSLIPSNFNTYILGLIKSDENLFKYNTGIRDEEGVIGKFTDTVLKSKKSATSVYDKRNDRITDDIIGSIEDDDISYTNLSILLIKELPIKDESNRFNSIYKEELKNVISSSPVAEFEYPTKPEKIADTLTKNEGESDEDFNKRKEEQEKQDEAAQAKYESQYKEIQKNREFAIEKAKENTIDRINEEREEAAKAAKKAAIEKEAAEHKNNNSSKNQ